MEISEIIQDQSVTILPKGRIDSVTVVDFEDKLSDLIVRNFTKIIIDFSTTDFISSSGLRILLMKEKQLRSRSGNLLLINLPEMIEEIFEVSGFSTVFKIQK